MILSTHAVVGGAAAGLLTSHPVIGAGVGFVSHLLLDMVPHWDYVLRSRVERPDGTTKDITVGPAFARDLIRIAADALIGVIVIGVAAWAFGAVPASWWIAGSAVVWGAAGGILPDALQFLYFRWPHEPLRGIYRLHQALHWWHSYGKVTDPRIGVILQGLVWIVALMIFAAAV